MNRWKWPYFVGGAWHSVRSLGGFLVDLVVRLCQITDMTGDWMEKLLLFAPSLVGPIYSDNRALHLGRHDQYLPRSKKERGLFLFLLDIDVMVAVLIPLIFDLFDADSWLTGGMAGKIWYYSYTEKIHRSQNQIRICRRQ